MAWPTTAILDSYTRADANPLNGSWGLKVVSGDINPKLVSGAVTPTATANRASAYWNASTFGPDVEVRHKIIQLPANLISMSLFARIVNPNQLTMTCYELRIVYNSAAADTWRFYRWSGQTATALGAGTFTQDVAAGGTPGFEVTGSTLNAYYHNGTSWSGVLGTVTDTTLTTAGYIGFGQEGAGTLWIHDDFGGGTISLLRGTSTVASVFSATLSPGLQASAAVQTTFGGSFVVSIPITASAAATAVFSPASLHVAYPYTAVVDAPPAEAFATAAAPTVTGPTPPPVPPGPSVPPPPTLRALLNPVTDPTETPHFALPFRLVGTTLAVNEQDSHADVAAGVEAVLRYPVGYRIDLPEFGTTDQTFAQGTVDLDRIRAEVVRWEPRARTRITGDPVADAVAAVTATVDTEGPAS